ncbi:WG repeat-containing protein [Chitinophaga arvensicola]|uniref:WG containing repeat-containing protein n=1 Tax=Chitinophaga arvensicola TaxID=29529 RepID=A0A1I0S6Z5_9BACT|nr:WG repeat-containing protein [Chitinophaga arvensicola]SEW51166.1 WG containing repeat-containing protein [Chitinophaga arvensicola]
MHIRHLLTGCFLLLSQTVVAQEGSPFKYGFAYVYTGDKGWYIDTTGKKVFDVIIGSYHPVSTTPADGSGHSRIIPDEKQDMIMVRSGNKKGIVNNGKWVVPAVYDSIEMKWRTTLVLRSDGKMTYADTYGKLLLPMEFEDAGILDDDHFDVKTGGKWGVYSTPAKKLIIPAIYEGFDYCGGCGLKGDYLFAQKDGKWGIIDFNNNVLLPFEYEHEHSFMRSDNWIRALKKNGQELVINLALKKEYLAPEFSDMSIIGNGLLKARKNGYYGLIDEDGKIVADFRYDDIRENESNPGPYFEVTEKGKTGILREDGKVILPAAYEGDITAYADCFIVQVDGNYTLLDTTGKQLLNKAYSEITPMGTAFERSASLPLFKLKQKALYGFYNPANGKIVEPAFFEIERTSVTSPATDLLEVSYKERNGLYNLAGEEVLPVIYQKLEDITPGFVKVREAGGTGIFDISHRRMLLPAKFESIYVAEADSNLWVTTKPGQQNDIYYNHKGMVVPAPKEKRGVVKKSGGLIEKKTAGDGMLYGYTDNNGKVMVPAVYERLLVDKNGRGFLAQKNSRFTVFNGAGQAVSKQTFEDVMLDVMPTYGSSTVEFTFPLLCRDGDIYRYLTIDGQFLPFEIRDITAFSPFGIYAIPE